VAYKEQAKSDCFLAGTRFDFLSMREQDVGKNPSVCQEVMATGNICGRKIYAGEKCICHCEETNKDKGVFDRIIRNIMNDESAKIFDFSGFVFPRSFHWPNKNFQNQAIFASACFLDDIDFSNVTFDHEVSFENAKFLKKATFLHSSFKALANFASSHFSDRTHFVKIQFHGGADFSHAVFGGFVGFGESHFGFAPNFTKATFENEANFIGAVFHGPARFDLVKFLARVTFLCAIFEKEAYFRSVDFCNCSAAAESTIDFSKVQFKMGVEFGTIPTDDPDYLSLEVENGERLPKEGSRFGAQTNFEKAHFDSMGVFSNTIFVAPAYFREIAALCKMDFKFASFQSECSFREARFQGDVKFEGSKFSRETNFMYTHFAKDAVFRPAVFAGSATFSNATFSGKADFGGSRFDGFCEFHFAKFEGKSTFIKTEFRKGATYLAAEFDIPEKVVFFECDLGKVSFLNCNVSKVQFHKVRWTCPGNRLPWSRQMVYDETTSNDFESVAQLYRQLQSNFIQNYRYAEASDFYVGEQEMVRKSKSLLGNFFHVLYKMASLYGERVSLPAFWLALVLITMPTILLWAGIDLNQGTLNNPKYEKVDYQWGFENFDLKIYLKDYTQAFFLNFGLITKTGKYSLPADSGQQILITFETILVVTLAALFLLALRRKFRRKSF